MRQTLAYYLNMEEKTPQYSYPDLSVSEAREQTQQTIERFFKEFQYRCQIREDAAKKPYDILRHKIEHFPNFRWQAVAPAGIGKTSMVAWCLSLPKGISVLYLVPDKKLAQEVYETLKALGVEVYLVEGRSEDNCERPELVRKLGRLGANVGNAACINGDQLCPFFSVCEYQQKKAEITSLPQLNKDDPARVFVGSHQYLTAHRFTGDPDLTVVDESHWQSFTEVFDLTEAELLAAGDKELEDYEAYYTMVSEFCQAIRQNPDGFVGRLARNPGLDIGAAIRHIGEVKAQHTQMGSAPDEPNSQIERAADNWKLPQLRKIEKLLNQLQFDLRRGVRFSNAVTSPAPGTIRVHGMRQNLIEGKTPALLIDGSADIGINRLIWGHRLRPIEVRAERNAKVYQVREKSFSKHSLGCTLSEAEKKKAEQLALQNEVIDFINCLAAQSDEPVFLAAPKKALALLQPHLHENVLTGNYAALRGQNKFEKCKVAVILSREQPPIEEVEKLARALQCKGDHRIKSAAGYVKQLRRRRLKGGRTELVPVWVHPDPFCQAVLEQLREREIEQALDRLRLMNENEPKEIWILNDLVLDVTVDETFRWADVTRGLPIQVTLQGFADKALAFPLPGTAWVKLRPDLWSTRDQVRGYVDRRGGIKWVETLIRLYKETDPYILAEYRTRGQRGKASAALICATEKDPRAALETVVGTVQEFKVIQTFPPIEEEKKP